MIVTRPVRGAEGMGAATVGKGHRNTTYTGVRALVSEDQFADLGAIGDQVDPESRFVFQHQARLEAKRAFIHLDTSKRVQRALLRSAKPIPQTYSVADVVCFRRDNRPGKTTWSPASRVIGHGGSENRNV